MAGDSELRRSIRAAIVVATVFFASFYGYSTASAQSCSFNAANDFICPITGMDGPTTVKRPAVNPFKPAPGASLFNGGTGPFTSFPDAPPSTIVPLTPAELIALQDAALAAIQKALEDAIAKAVEEAERLEAMNGTTVVCEPTGNSIVKADNDFCSLDKLNCSGNCPKAVNSGGECYGDFTLTRDMPTSYRTEVVSQNGKLDFGKEYTISYDFNFADWAKDSDAETGAFQVHQTPFDWSSHGKAETGACSGASQVGEGLLTTIVQDDTFKVYTYGGKLQYSVPVDKQTWQSAQWTIIPSKGSDGLIELTLNGVKVFSVSGQNVPVADRCGRPFREPYPKFGIYKWNWKEGRPDTDSNRRQLLLGNLKIIEGEAICTPVTADGGGGSGGAAEGGPVPPGTCAGPVPTGSGSASLNLAVNFNDGSGFKDHIYEAGKNTIVSTDSRDAGGKSMLFEVAVPPLTPEQCDLKRYRAEIDAKAPKIVWDDGKSYWNGVSFNPQDFSGSAYTLFQIHAPNEVAGSACDYAGNALSVIPTEKNGKMYYAVRVIEKGGRSTGTGANSNTTEVWSTPMVEGQWADFVFNYTLSTKGQGYYQVWYNGQLVYQKSGLTNVNHIDSCGNPVPADKRESNGPHIGIYGPPCAGGAADPDPYRSLLADELRVATGPDGYDLVDPSKGANAVNNSCQ